MAVTEVDVWDLIYTERFPELGTEPISTERYLSIEYFELERRRVFGQSWLAVGRIEDVPRPRDYVIRTIEVLPASILVVRGEDGEVRAFHNVCSHRGNLVCKRSDNGNSRRFTCEYHGWTYDCRGRLLSVPDEQLFPGIEKDALGLTPIECEIWEGFIFVRFDSSRGESLREFLGTGMYDQYVGAFEGLTPMWGVEATVRCNWKACVDAFVETYHFATIHRRSIPDVTRSKGDPRGHIVDARFEGPHRIISTYANPEHKPTPTEMLAWQYGQGFHSAVTEKKRDQAPGINRANHPLWNSDITVIFPNMDINIIGDWCLALWFWPVDVQNTRFVARAYMPAAVNAGMRLSQRYTVSRLRETLREDLDNLESVQSGMETRAKMSMPLSDREIAIRHGLKSVADFVGQEG